jgi:S-adenosylmethionine:tRNA ribosyltransferase-isomerase
MLTSEFDYNLPKKFIAQTPLDKRDESKLMVIDRNKKQVTHKQFFDIVDYLRPGDVLVWNTSKVFKARLFGETEVNTNCVHLKKGVGDDTEVINIKKPVEIFLIRPMENDGVWKVLAKPGKRLRLGMKVVFAPDFICEVLAKEDDGTVLVQFADDDFIVRAKANKYGSVPIPPYIQGEPDQESLTKKYQTVYAKDEGSVAAPTAGFHFTEKLIEKIKAQGVEFAEVTLHVGLGTFQPVKENKTEDHKMHSEWVELTANNCQLIEQAKKEGRRIIAVGTTTTRTLEGIYQKFNGLNPYAGDINIFITPPYKFKVIDGLITNLHLPKSTLLMLVSAFVEDKDFLMSCYEEAKKEDYRFFSFGDAMILV